MRILTFAATFAFALLTSLGGASAQYYEPGYAPGYAVGHPQQSRYNRVIVTHDAVPPDRRRAYPYVRPSVAPLPYQPVPGYRYRRTRGHVARVAKPAYRATHRAGQTMHVRRAAKHVAAPQRRSSAAGKKTSRVIRAEAEVRIIGNDQMSIRLFRKRPGSR
jgi:hypothetical protein